LDAAKNLQRNTYAHSQCQQTVKVIRENAGKALLRERGGFRTSMSTTSAGEGGGFLVYRRVKNKKKSEAFAKGWKAVRTLAFGR